MNDINIKEFAKLTRSTVKTVLYYHKIGLLQEPKRSENGYRIYGAEDMARMQMIQHLKGLGLDLSKIKEIISYIEQKHDLREIFIFWKQELLSEKARIEEQLLRVDDLLGQTQMPLEQGVFQSDIFQTVTKILEPVKEEYEIKESTELNEQHNKVFGMIEDFSWGDKYKENLQTIAQYFKAHPDQYQRATEFGKRLSALRTMEVDDPEVDNLAREGADFIKEVPELKEMLYGQVGLGESYEDLMDDMAKKVLSPAQMRHKELIQKYLDYKGKE